MAEVVLAGDQLELLVGGGQRLLDRAGVGREHAAVGERLHDQRRHGDALEVRAPRHCDVCRLHIDSHDRKVLVPPMANGP